jgi:UDP-3-O-[3-hydroxymyristoyl] glucosamine N-acyltransferase
MTPKDNELRMKIGLVVTYIDDELLFVRSEKYSNTLDALQAFADLVRQDEREACAKLVEGGNHVHPKAPDAVWAKTVAKLIRARGNT